MTAAFFVVRATVPDPAKRAAFDAWYQNEHLPDATKSFGVAKAWRFWSLTDPSLHQATYQFTNEALLDHAVNGAEMKRLIADFNRDWPEVTRTREILVLAEEFGAGVRMFVIPGQPAGLNPESGDVQAWRFRVRASARPGMTNERFVTLRSL